MHFGVRKRFAETPDRTGVEVLTDVDPEEMENYALKYPAPAVETGPESRLLYRLTAHEIQALYGAVDSVAAKPPAPKGAPFRSV